MARRGGVVATLLEDMDIPTIITESHTFRGQKSLELGQLHNPHVWNRNSISQIQMISCSHILLSSLNICHFGKLFSSKMN